MSASGPTTQVTPSRVSPVQWMCTFAYTPSSAHTRQDGHPRPERVAPDSEGLVPPSEDDALPTRFHSRTLESCATTTLGGVLMPGRPDPVLLPGDGPDAYVSDLSLKLSVPAKRKRPGRDREGLPDPSSSVPACLNQGQRGTRKTRSRTSAMGGSGHDQGLSPYAPALTIRPRCRRVVLDAVEIVSKKRSRGCLADPIVVHPRCPTKSAHKEASSYYPSPPVSREDREVAVHGSNSRSLVSHYPIATERKESASPEQASSSSKTSKYFARASAVPTCPVPKHIPVLTPPSSPILAIPVYIESSDFEYPPPHVSSDETVQGILDESSVPTWYNNPGLFEDLMIMLRRLKPILVQESVRDDPWKVLIAVRLLNVTTGKAAIPVFCKIISRWPTPQDLVCAPQDELIELLRPLGLYNKRASWLRTVSERFIQDRRASSSSRTSLASLLSEERIEPTAAPPLHYPGVGPYALDSLRIFCSGDKEAWKFVVPRDKELVRYLRWRWAVEGGKVWYPGGMGVIGDMDVPYLITLVDELAAHYDSAIGGEGYMYHFCNDLCGVLSGSANKPLVDFCHGLYFDTSPF